MNPNTDKRNNGKVGIGTYRHESTEYYDLAYRRHRSTIIKTGKQIKSRAKAKRAKQARKVNR